MRGLVLKDFYNMKKSYLAVMGVLIFLSVMSVIQGENLSECIPTILVLIPTIVISNTFDFDNKNKWEHYAMTMPVTRKDIIKSRYLILILSVIAITLVTIIANIIVASLNGEILLSSLIKEVSFCISIGIIISSVMIPIVCKFGLEKMRVIYIACMFIGTFFVAQLTTSEFLMSKINNLVWLSSYMEIIVPVLAIFICFISYIISVKIYKKKEF